MNYDFQRHLLSAQATGVKLHKHNSYHTPNAQYEYPKLILEHHKKQHQPD